MNDAQLFQQAGTMFIAGAWCKGTDSSPVFDKYSGAVLGTVERASKGRSMPQLRCSPFLKR
jgi:hypothetical protein